MTVTNLQASACMRHIASVRVDFEYQDIDDADELFDVIELKLEGAGYTPKIELYTGSPACAPYLEVEVEGANDEIILGLVNQALEMV
ncbi:hypothetical protein [Caldimonas sp. KR1-144]|uniref:hypothetical protein n=1 Tax=Caldimonas sp. KR1-144 TaxID=3400911 RepID=UPI003C0E78C4